VTDRFRSHWQTSAAPTAYPPLPEARTCDIVVIGAGIVGVSAALELCLAGADVVLLEARRIGAGASGYTTGKISALNGLIYADLEGSFGADTAAAYGAANEAGLETIAANTERYGIECDFRRKPNFSYSESASGRERIVAEAEAARRAGLGAELVDEIEELPFPVAAAVRLERQAEFHALRYLHGLAEAAAARGCEIYERSRAVEVNQGEPCRVRTAGGVTLRAERVIVATHLPFIDRGLYFARTYPQRSYALLAHLRGPVPRGMYLSDESPAHSLRAVPTADGERLLVGGESHRPGQGEPAERYEALEGWARERFDVLEVESRWATQDHMPHDRLPFVGPLLPFTERVLIVTGLQKWGLAMGTSAGASVAGLALGKDEVAASAFDPRRLDFRHGATSQAKENAVDGLHFFVDRLAGRRRSSAGLEPGEGAIVSSGLSQQAAYRDEEGELHLHSARCSHLGCIVKFNAAEHTWDCPCHGSRFDARDGAVLEGPAVRPLPPAENLVEAISAAPPSGR
jgi:glycine/D-amino acid oxidase-like deaminating enzyme/nitrite reductase/ring-hydroxylating ferredoxin subunit